VPDATVNTWEDNLIADLRANGGRPSAGPLAGEELLVLYSTGAKSGERRRAILSTTHDGDDFIVTGTNNGRPSDPAWVLNIQADPNVEFEAGGKTYRGVAAIVDAADRQRLWANHVEVLPRFADYPAQVGGRISPVVRLTPVG
jgi:deazaflavin-dependent oxidoreductase (nitroreductase family)